MNYLNNFKIIKNEISSFKKKISIIVVTKNQSLDKIIPFVDDGHNHFGENRVQEALSKWDIYLKTKPYLNLHLIGKLQSNKAKDALRIFNYVHSLDTEKLAIVLDKEEALSLKKIKYFIQVNIGNELQKNGISPSNLKKFINFCRNNTRLNIIGLMCLPPLNDNPKIHFEKLKNLADENQLYEISMGMSSDYIKAIEAGSTFIRVGSKIFN
jgi:pyridoxal phosphate enzyme (YggS family)